MGKDQPTGVNSAETANVKAFINRARARAEREASIKKKGGTVGEEFKADDNFRADGEVPGEGFMARNARLAREKLERMQKYDG